MNFQKLSIFCVFLLLLFNIESRLNFPKLLLPYYSEVINKFTLEATEGCLFWRSARTDVALVRPLEITSILGCSRKAVVEVVWRSQKRKTAVIFAEDSVTGKELRCEVIVDKIHSFGIQTTTKELNIDDSPEKLSLVAYNNKGDVFSSLDGMVFNWSIVADDKGGIGDVPTPDKILRFMKFHESSFTAPPHIKSLELQGKSGNIVLVEALQTGVAVVSVRPADEVYKDVEVPVVKVMVMENFKLSLGLLYIVPHGEVKITVEHLEQGIAREIAMPSTSYYLEVDDEQVASLDPSTSTLIGAFPGHTELRLRQHNARITGIFREPTADIYVVDPGYIEFGISPKDVWVLEVGVVYEVTLLLFDDNGHKITISQNLNFETQFPSHLMEVLFSANNGTHHVVRTVSKGSAHILSRLLSLIKKDGRVVTFEHVEGKQLDPASLNFAELILPVLRSPVDSDACGMHEENLSKDNQMAGNSLQFLNL